MAIPATPSVARQVAEAAKAGARFSDELNSPGKANMDPRSVGVQTPPKEPPPDTPRHGTRKTPA
jgi:hypothetical protein